MKKLSDWLKKRAVLIVIILAAVLLEVISAIQYRYTRGLLEEELEKSALQDLMTSALRIQEIVVKAEVGVSSQVWHTQRHLDDPDYMNMLVDFNKYNDDKLDYPREKRDDQEKYDKTLYDTIVEAINHYLPKIYGEARQ